MNQVINHPEFGKVEVEIINDEPWFVAKDVCNILGLDNVTKALYALDEYEKLTYQKVRAGQNRELNFINESGLYALIIRSNKPEAKLFRKWVTAEVLPAIRKTGFYSHPGVELSAAEKRAEKRVILALYKNIDSHLSQTDKRLIAKQCHTDVFYINRVLRLEVLDVYASAALLARATANKQLYKQFYTQAGAEQLMAELAKAHLKPLPQ